MEQLRVYCERCGADLYQVTFKLNAQHHPNACFTVRHNENGMHTVEMSNVTGMTLSGLPQE